MKNKLFLLSELLRRDLAARYAGSFAGPLWAVLNPAVVCGLYAFVFVAVWKLPPPEGFRGSFVEFLLAGVLPWMGVQEAITRATTVVADQAHLVKKLRFPIEMLVASAVGAALVIEAAGIALFTLYLVLSGRGAVRPGVLLVAFAFQLLLLAGPALILAALNVFFRDLSQILPPFLMIGFYLTPILYPEEKVPHVAARFLVLNPLRDLVALFRAALFGAPAPPIGRVVAWSLVLVVVGFIGMRLFRRCRPSFADLL
ncbi:MAG: ABC transporter permease [Acidobacteriota bacterium]|nr:ABC transporter permease [Acidobacteriota bacterium]